jgi:hypothetical protein
VEYWLWGFADWRIVGWSVRHVVGIENGYNHLLNLLIAGRPLALFFTIAP